MIRNPQDHQRQAEQERWQELRQMTIEQSIAIGEALLPSEIMQLAELPADDHPRSLAVALGIPPRPAVSPSDPRRGGPCRRANSTSSAGSPPICDEAEDHAPWQRLQRIIAGAH